MDEGVEQLNVAFEVNLLDTTEIFPVPTTTETQGDTDRTEAEFLKGRSREDAVLLATKVAGRSEQMTWLRKDGCKRVMFPKKDASVESEQLHGQLLPFVLIQWLQCRLTIS